MKEKFVVLIPARGGSQRIPNKNVKKFAHSSLLEIKLLQAKRVLGNEAKVILNTDSEEYLKKYSSLYDIGILRPKNYGSSEIPMNEVYEYFADSLKNYEFIIYLNPTSPLLKDSSLKSIFEIYLSSGNKSITTVTSHQEYLWMNNKPLNYSPDYHPRSQDLPPFYTLNFAASILKIQEMKQIRNIITKSPSFFKLDNIEAFDIDEEWQFNLAEQLFLSINHN